MILDSKKSYVKQCKKLNQCEYSTVYVHSMLYTVGNGTVV